MTVVKDVAQLANGQTKRDSLPIVSARIVPPENLTQTLASPPIVPHAAREHLRAIPAPSSARNAQQDNSTVTKERPHPSIKIATIVLQV